MFIGYGLLIYFRIPKNQNNLLNILSCLFILILGLFGNVITPDYTSYTSIVKEVSETAGTENITHIEPFFIWLIHHTGNNFFLYQCCIFIPQCLVVYLIVRNTANTNIQVFYFLFFTICLYWGFISGRSSLYAYIFILGLLFLAEREIILGLIIIAFSCFLHKSAQYFIPFVTVLLLVPINRIIRNKILFFIFLCIGIIIGLIVKRTLQQYIDGYLEIEGVVGSQYLTSERGLHDGRSAIWDMIFNIQTFIFMMGSIYLIFKLRFDYDKFSSFLKLMYKVLFWIIAVSALIISLGIPNGSITYRLLVIGYIPFCILFSNNFNIKNINFNKKLFVTLCGVIYMILTNMYILGVERNTYHFF